MDHATGHATGHAWIENGSLAVRTVVPDCLPRNYKDRSVSEQDLLASGRVLHTWIEQVHCVHEYQDYGTNEWSVVVIGGVGHVVPCPCNVLLKVINELRAEERDKRQGRKIAS